jgi:hypothetical protein
MDVWILVNFSICQSDCTRCYLIWQAWEYPRETYQRRTAPHIVQMGSRETNCIMGFLAICYSETDLLGWKTNCIASFLTHWHFKRKARSIYLNEFRRWLIGTRISYENNILAVDIRLDNSKKLQYLTPTASDLM